MSNFRIALLAVLAILVIGSAYYWMSVANRPAEPQAPVGIEVSLTKDGAVAIGGEVITEPGKLKARFAEIRKTLPRTSVTVHMPKGMATEDIAKAVKLLHESGESSVSFEIEPDDRKSE